MITSNRHPGNAARGPRRAFLLQAVVGLLAALLTAPVPAPAQGVINFNAGLYTFTEYRIGLDGTGSGPLTGFPQLERTGVYVTSQSYPGVGRLFLYSQVDDGNYSNLMVWSE